MFLIWLRTAWYLHLGFHKTGTSYTKKKYKEKNIPKLRKDLELFDGAESGAFVSEDGLQMPRNEKNRLKQFVTGVIA